jgi:hypothetical protein
MHANFFKLVIQVIRLEASYLKKPRSLILNQSNIDRTNWKKNSYTKGFLKIAIKKIKIKI